MSIEDSKSENFSEKNSTPHEIEQQEPEQPKDEKIDLKADKKPGWQERLLPVMRGLLIGLAIFFFAVTFMQMSYLHWTIFQIPAIDINPTSGANFIESAETFENRLEARKLETRSLLEAYLVQNRYHHASVLIMSGLWLRYLGFVTGMILALVGASFVLGKMREPEQKLEGKFSTIGVSLQTTSPGIILAVLGVLLMYSTIVDKDIYEVQDTSIYMGFVEPDVLSTAESDFEALPPEEIFPSLLTTPEGELPTESP